jgi:hypothetical protein
LYRASLRREFHLEGARALEGLLRYVESRRAHAGDFEEQSCVTERPMGLRIAMMLEWAELARQRHSWTAGAVFFGSFLRGKGDPGDVDATLVANRGADLPGDHARLIELVGGDPELTD